MYESLSVKLRQMTEADRIIKEVNHRANLRNGEIVARFMEWLRHPRWVTVYARPGFPDIDLDFPQGRESIASATIHMQFCECCQSAVIQGRCRCSEGPRQRTTRGTWVPIFDSSAGLVTDGVYAYDGSGTNSI